ncbi:sugar porter family MFS transporter [Alloacidobacterium sp.]|uniref:sugar porter family MFS transporter n=1 Tax=Alloacidobacterium sp. TaxID=2951999 RepID=UPI002D3D0A56|nr:sugar porter family MFS transporter [Alloacidobacterium sp.]HYK36299.1 sugar porter family MFS transporter [Alloacidobacterium sp.]
MSSSTTKNTDVPHSGSYAYRVCAIAALAGLLFGFDIAVINGALVFLRDQFHLSDFSTELAASSLLAGCIAGALIAGWLSDRYGRRSVLAASGLLFAVSSVGAALPRNFIEFGIARFAGGIAIGIASMLAPLYMAEVSPARIRGRLVSLNQMAIVTGILFAYLVNWSLSFQGQSGWRWMFAIAVLPSLGLFIGLFFVPESPRWLVERKRIPEALDVLKKIEGRNAEAQLAMIQNSVLAESGTFSDLLAPALHRPLFLAVALAILQQITGINTVLFYGSVIWERQLGSSSHSTAIGANVTIGLINFLATIVALWLIDRLGRRPLLMFSSGCMAVCQLLLGIAFLLPSPPALLVLGCMLLCVAVFAVGLGPGAWVLMAELFPTRVRGRAMSVANTALWIASFVLTATFLSLAHAITITGAFCVYSVMCVLTFLLVQKLIPETKGKSLEEIEQLWM